VPVVAEEAAAARPELLDLIVGAPRAWVVDPLDGTQAFIDGSPDDATHAMVRDHLALG
jgi:fructose-1,6-bisphosphatase/inositol monophosphatase family enzyme